MPGIFVYEPGKLLPRFDQNLNGILDVLIPAKYLTYDNPQVKKKAIWGTDIYTDDSDVVSSKDTVLYHCFFFSSTLANTAFK